VKPILVGGKFRVTFEVIDGLGQSISKIDSTTNTPWNRVTIENVCQLPKVVKVEVLLPNGQQRLEFKLGGNSQTNWTKSTLGAIASKGTATLECEIAHKGGPANPKEPIQLDKILSQPALNTTFLPETDPKIPFQIVVHVS